MIKILIVDDQVIVRQGLRMRLSLENDIEVVGEAEDGQSALALIQERHPNVVVMDAVMPVMDGFESAAILHQRYPDLYVIILSIYDSPDMRARALQAGAFAFVEKRNGVNALLRIIHQAFAKDIPSSI